MNRRSAIRNLIATPVHFFYAAPPWQESVQNYAIRSGVRLVLLDVSVTGAGYEEAQT
ncbi:MAG TPA: hypothetical protein VMG40_05350 [Bryobacteraceae bacterium]|nr:hypothetical protein [Bryobacteraceae bacterium]